MPQFDVYRNPSAASREAVPFVVDIQSDLLGQLATRLTIPLGRAGASPGWAPRSLCPVLSFEGEKLQLLPHLAAAFRTRDLGRPIGSVQSQASVLVSSLDAAVSGV